MSTTSTKVVRNQEYDFFYSAYDLYSGKNKGLLHLEKQIKSFNQMLSTMKYMNKEIKNPVAKVTVDRMESVVDEFRDVIEEMIDRLYDMQDRANYFSVLEDEANEIEYPEA